MDPLVTQILRKAGWTGRYSNARRDLSVVAREGFAVSSAAEDFLHTYGGISVSFPSAYSPGRLDDFHTRAAEAAANWDASQASFPECGELLTPVGEAYQQNMLLLVGESGALYVARDYQLVRLGANPEAGLLRLVSERI